MFSICSLESLIFIIHTDFKTLINKGHTEITETTEMTLNEITYEMRGAIYDVYNTDNILTSINRIAN